MAQGIQMSPTAYGALQIALKKGDLGPVASFEELGLSITRRGKVPIKVRINPGMHCLTC